MKTLALTALALVTLIAATAPAPAGSSTQWYTCNGWAPDVTSCSTGTFVYDGTFVSYGFQIDCKGQAVWCYVGSEESRVTSPEGVDSIVCDAAGVGVGVAQCTWNGGKLPLPGEAFRHDCFSYDYGTRNPGGHGEFECALVKD